MSLSDAAGRLWAHQNTVKVGDKLQADGGFTCLAENEIRIVQSHAGHMPGYDPQPPPGCYERLYIECGDGMHFLDGQTGDDGELIGLYNAAVACLMTGSASWILDTATVAATIFA